MKKKYVLIVFLFFSFYSVLSQQLVTGKVFDEKDESLPGATVLIKGTLQGTTTDISGAYSLIIPVETQNPVLVYEFLGYESHEINVDNRSVIDVRMEQKLTSLQEVVVVGYGKVEKGDVTGVISSVDSETFNKGVMTSADQLISGKIAGVSVMQRSGEPGGQINIRIRGGTSLTASNEPLFVIDGVPIDNTAHDPGGYAKGRNPLNFLNPNEIENITVLKDASAAAIYGTRGANGVIIITTKTGSNQDGPTVNYDFNYGFSMFTEKLSILNADDFRTVMSVYGTRNIDKLGTSTTDWFNEIIRVATTQNHNLSLAGNLKNGGYRFSLGFQDVNGLYKTSNTKRTNINFNFNQSFLNNSLDLRFSTKSAILDDIYASQQIGAALTMDPTQPIYDENSQFGNYFEWGTNINSVKNPVSELNENKQIGDSFRSLNNVDLVYKLPFLPGLSARTNISFDIQRGKRARFAPSFIKSQQSNRGNWAQEEFKRESLLIEGIVEYNKEIESIDSDLSFIAGYSFQDFYAGYMFYSVDSLVTNLFGINTPSVGESSIIRVGNSILQNRLISFYGRLNFSLKDKYIFTATLRQDGSTRFGEKNRWGLFPSFAAGWRISNEPFMEGILDVVNYLKLRVGWGITGSQEIEDYKYIASYKYSEQQAQYQLGRFYPTLRPEGVDPNLKWEETYSLNVGLDFEFLNGKLAGSIEYYTKNTNDLLFTIAFPAGSVLEDRILTNIGAMKNEGVELELGYNLVHNDLRVNLNFNMAYNKNEIVKLDNARLGGGQEEVVYEVNTISGDVGQTIQVLKVGYPINTFFTYEQKYESGAPIYSPNELTNMYVDQNNDGIINEKDKVAVGYPNPDLLLGFTANIFFKNIDFSFTLRSNIGNYVYNNSASNLGNFQGLNGDEPNNIHTSALITKFDKKQLLSNYYLENGSFLKLDNITVGYTFKKAFFKALRLYITAQNVLNMTGYSGFDPEVLNGIDNNIYPRSITFIGGLNVTF